MKHCHKTDRVLLKHGEGAICGSMVRCGRSTCKCARGELHGPYFYRFYRDKQGRQHRQYIPKAQVEAELEKQQERRDDGRRLRAFFHANTTDYRRVTAEVREMIRPYQAKYFKPEV